MQMLRDAFLQNILEVYFGMDIKKIEPSVISKTDAYVEKHITVRFKNGERDTVRSKQYDSIPFEWSYYRVQDSEPSFLPKFLFGMRMHSGDYVYFLDDAAMPEATRELPDFALYTAVQQQITMLFRSYFVKNNASFEKKRLEMADFYRPFGIAPEKEPINSDKLELSADYSPDSFVMIDKSLRCMDINRLDVHYPGYGWLCLTKGAEEVIGSDALFASDTASFAARCEYVFDKRSVMSDKSLKDALKALTHD